MAKELFCIMEKVDEQIITLKQYDRVAIEISTAVFEKTVANELWIIQTRRETKKWRRGRYT